MAQIGSLSVKLGLVTVEWDKATDNAKRSAKELQEQFNKLGEKVKTLGERFKEISGIGAVLGFGELYHEAVLLTDEISDMAKGFGLSTGEVLAFGEALQQSGGRAETADKALNTLFGKIADAKSGNDSAIAQFEQLGISFDELKRLSPYEAIQKVADGFSNISDQFEKTKAIKEVFGKAGIGLDMQNLAEVLKEGTGEFDKYDASIQKVGQVSDALKKNLTNLTLAFADLIAPFSQSHIYKIEQFSAVLKGIASVAIIASIGAVAQGFVSLAVAIKEASAAGALFNLTAGGATPIGLILKAITAATAIGTFLYITSGSKSEEEKKSDDRVAAYEKAKILTPAQIQAARNVQENAPYDAKFKSLPDNSDAKFAHMPLKEGETETPTTPAVSNEVKAKQASIALTKELMRLDKLKNQFELDLTKTELEKKLYAIDKEAEKKKAQIDAQAAQQLVSGGDKMTKELKDNILGEAAISKQKVEQERLNARSAANQSDSLDRQKKTITAQEQSRQELEQMQNELLAFVDTQDKATSAFYDQAEEANRVAKLANDRIEYETKLLMLSDKQRQNLLDEYDLEVMIADTKRQAKLAGVDVESNAFKNLTENMKATGKATMTFKRQQEDAQRTFEYGWANAFNAYTDAATNAAKTGADSFNIVFGSINDALDKFVENGKISFGDLAQSIIKDLLKIQLKAAAANWWASMGSGGGVLNAALSIFGFADGGDPPVNQVSMVGENGPELFVPKTAGTIIPNDKIGNMGGTTNNTVYNINAIDTKSFEERILGSSRAVWAANAYGAKSVAVGRGRT